MRNQSTTLSLLLKLLTAFFGTIGVPVAIWTLFQSTWTAHPLLAFGLLMGYEIALFVIGYFTLVFQKLRDRWAEESAEQVDHFLHRLLAGYERRYRRWLIYQHRDFDVKGLSTQGTYTLDLQQVFVELHIDPTTLHQANSNPLHQLASPTNNGRSIWGWLRMEQLQNQQLAIIGSPGSGKTSLLKHIALTLAIHQPKGIRQRMVFLLSLREVNYLLETQQDCTLVEAIEASLQRHCPAPASWVAQQLSKDRSLVLLDGLDEVASAEQRRRATAWVDQQMRDYGGNRFIVTSRPFGYRNNPLGGVAVLEVRPFNSEQIKRFISSWYLANERLSSRRNDLGVRAKAADGSQDLLQRLNGAPSLLALAVNPLLLTMIATVHRYRSSLPGKRVNLYEEICEVTLGKRQEARGVTLEIDARQKKQVLQPLAWTMMTRNALDQREISAIEACRAIETTLQMVAPHLTPERFLKIVEESSGLLLEHEQGSYSFAHLTFQEYLASTHAKEAGLETELAQHVGESWWHETIRLYCAQTDATIIVSACLASQTPSVATLTLAADCLEEALKLAPATRSEVESILTMWINELDPKHEARRRLGAEVLLARRLKNMPLWNEKVSCDTSLITVAEYRLFRHVVVSLGADQESKPMLGVSDKEALTFCDWLNSRDPRGGYHLPSSNELPSPDEEHKLMRHQAKSIGYWVLPIEALSENQVDHPHPELHWLQGPPEKEVLALRNANMLISASIYLCIILFLITDYLIGEKANDTTIQRNEANLVRSQLTAFSQALAKFDMYIQYGDLKVVQTPNNYDYLCNITEIMTQTYIEMQGRLGQTSERLSQFLSHPIGDLYAEMSRSLSLSKIRELLRHFISRYDKEFLRILTLIPVHELAGVLELELDGIKELDLVLHEPSLLTQEPQTDTSAELVKMLMQARVEHMRIYLNNNEVYNNIRKPFSYSRFISKQQLPSPDIPDMKSINSTVKRYKYALNRLLRERNLLTPCEGILLMRALENDSKAIV